MHDDLRPKHFLKWALETFGPMALDRRERLARFVEEAIELAHAEGMPRDTPPKSRSASLTDVAFVDGDFA